MAVRACQFFTIILFWIAGRISSHDWSPSMIAKYFDLKNVHTIDAIVCSEKDRRKVFKYFTITAREDGYYGLFRIIRNLDELYINDEVRTGVYIDISCPSNQQLLRNTTSMKLFTINFIWLIWDQDTFLMNLTQVLPISTFSDVTVATSGVFTQLSTSANSLPAELHSVGGWNNSTQEPTLQKLNVRINFQKSTVRAAIMFIENIYNTSEIYEQLQDDTFKPGGDVSNRFMFGNALHLAYLYNFTLNLVTANNWGVRLANGTWTGMLGLLQQNEVDMTLSPMLPLSQRLEISYPVVPILPYWMAIIFKQPRALGTYRAMILELSLNTWACVGVTIVVGAIVFALTQKYGPVPDASHDSEGSFALGALQSIGIIANQGLSVTPEGTSSRIVSLFLLLVGLLVSNYYSAATMTALLSESPPVIKNLEQLIASKPSLTTVDAPYIRNKDATQRVFRDFVIDRMEEDNALRIYSLEDGVQSIMKGSAFLGEYFVLFNAINSKIQSDAICDLTVFNAGFYMNSMYFVKKCPHFRELFMRGTIRTLEHGLMLKERRKWIAERTTCSRVTEFIHVQLEAVSVALGVFSLGAFVSISLLLIEIFMARRARFQKDAKTASFAKTLN